MKARRKKKFKPEEDLRPYLRDVVAFAGYEGALVLRSYQQQVARAVVNSVLQRLGQTFVVMFPRQSGKNELQAQIEAYLMLLLSTVGAELVKVSPTLKPQSLNAMRRLERVLQRNRLSANRWRKESGFIYRIGAARMFFLSGMPPSNVVGLTASTLLECDEAQEILISKWDKDFSPMAASTNATRVFWGTAWSPHTLLARELRLARGLEKLDGVQRTWLLTADDVRKEVTAYGLFVDEQVARFGRTHPLVRTQFFSEELDAEGGMFPPDRRARMLGEHPPRLAPQEGRLYACMIDIAGEEEDPGDGEGCTQLSLGLGVEPFRIHVRRDSTAFTVVEVDLSTLADDLICAPSYRVVYRMLWTGIRHTRLYGELRGLIEHWRAVYAVIDSTGVGAGLSSFLAKAFPEKVIPFGLNQATKSMLGWEFLGVVDSGRFKDYRNEKREARVVNGEEGNQEIWPSGNQAIRGEDEYRLSNLQSLFFRQCEFCDYEVIPGPGKVLRWGVDDARRDPETGELVHDDLLISAALCAVLDRQKWSVRGEPVVVHRPDPLAEMDGEGY